MHAQAHDRALVGPHTLDDVPQVRGEPIDELRRQLDLHELADEALTDSAGLLCVPTVNRGRRNEAFVGAPDLGETLCGFLRVRPEIRLFLFVIDVVSRRPLLRRRDFLFLLVRIDVTGEDIGELRFARRDRRILCEKRTDRGGIAREGLKGLVQAALDALRDLDLAFAGEEVDRAHLAHVHAHRVRGSTELAVDGGERGRCLLGVVVVVIDGRTHEQEGVGIGRHLVHGDPHVVDHRDDVLDLLGIDDAFWQVVVDLGVREVTLLLALCDEQLQPRLLLVEIHAFTHDEM